MFSDNEEMCFLANQRARLQIYLRLGRRLLRTKIVDYRVEVELVLLKLSYDAIGVLANSRRALLWLCAARNLRNWLRKLLVLLYQFLAGLEVSACACVNIVRK